VHFFTTNTREIKMVKLLCFLSFAATLVCAFFVVNLVLTKNRLSLDPDNTFEVKTQFLSQTNKRNKKYAILEEGSTETAKKTKKNTKPKIWISMGLCFSENTKKYGKEHYPYSEVTPLALLLWSYFFPKTDEVSTIIFLVHNEPNKTEHMEVYEKTLIPTGVTVVIILPIMFLMTMHCDFKTLCNEEFFK
jgi:hypothetical protein